MTSSYSYNKKYLLWVWGCCHAWLCCGSTLCHWELNWLAQIIFSLKLDWSTLLFCLFHSKQSRKTLENLLFFLTLLVASSYLFLLAFSQWFETWNWLKFVDHPFTIFLSKMGRSCSIDFNFGCCILEEGINKALHTGLIVQICRFVSVFSW